MLYTSYLVPELAAFDPFQASRALEFASISVCEGRRASIDAANGI